MRGIPASFIQRAKHLRPARALDGHVELLESAVELPVREARFHDGVEQGDDTLGVFRLGAIHADNVAPDLAQARFFAEPNRSCGRRPSTSRPIFLTVVSFGRPYLV